MLKRTAITALIILTAACSNEVSEEQPPTKATVSQAIGQGQDLGDVCAEQGWYGDGECDTFCTNADPVDCDGTVVACAEFIEIADGVCSRPADDPCIFQDPDCSDDIVVCPAMYSPPDGVCDLPEDDPCRSNDADCVDDEPIACPALAMEPNGVCDLPDTDPCQFIDPDCPQTEPGNPGEPGTGGGSEPGGPGTGGGSEPGFPGQN